MGASKVIVVQRSRARVQAAWDFGADVVICTEDEDVVARVREESDGLGAHLVITANPAPSSHADALEIARKRGRINLFGGLPAGSTVELDTNLVHYKELTVAGAHGALPSHHRQALELIASGVVEAGRFVSHTFALDDVEQAFQVAESHVGMRVAVLPWGEEA
jgi:L-iditol 2-dehydrogenase